GLGAANSATPWLLAGLVLVLAVACWLAAKLIPASGRAAPDLVITRNPLTSTLHLVKDLAADRRLWIGGLITSWFWLVGAVVLALQPQVMKDLVGGSEGVITLGLVVFTIGIAIGSALAARASKER